MVHSAARRQGIGATSLTVTSRTQFVPRLRVTEPSLVLVRHGHKVLTWQHRRLVVPAGAALALPAGQVVDIVNRPSRDGVYEEVWLSGDAAFASSAFDGLPAASGTVVIEKAPAALRLSFERAVEAIMFRNAVPFGAARTLVAEALQRGGLLGGHGAQRARGAGRSNVAVTVITTGVAEPCL
jgi:hypothetical protein